MFLPPEYENAEKLLYLHMYPYGVISARTQPSREMPFYQQAWSTGRLPRCAIGSWASPQKIELYSPSFDGSEDYLKLFTEEWMPFVNSKYNLAPYIGVLGRSAGALGAINIALSHPEMISCVAAQDAPLDPVHLPRKITGDKWLFGRNHKQCQLHALPIHKTNANLTAYQMGGVFTSEWDFDHWQKEICALWKVRNNADRIRESKMRIFLKISLLDEVGTQDGGQALHQELIKHDIPHFFRLESNCYHFGKSIGKT